VRTILIEATRDQTEAALLRELRRHFRELSPQLSLAEIVRDLREGAWLPQGEKLVIVLDQFEQWLHGWRQDDVAPLVDMLRQCDGSRVQGLVLVRDDFWMPTTRFFQQLDVPLVEGANASAVDLFDRTHALKVLTAFGVSYGRLPADPARQTYEQQRFLERAVTELAVNDWIVPVRLCIFVEMVKSRPWTPSALEDVGGTQGLGAAFLEDVFDSGTASPLHRMHRKAARLVLERLLPSRATDIRGHLVSESELLAVSGYEGQPSNFVALMRCLDQELRLITPSETQDDGPGGAVVEAPGHAPRRLFQLTHDFLVTAIRGWLNQSRQRTLRGRAALRLAEYADAYAARPESRHLPAWWDWLNLLLLTQRRRWQPAERSMMQQATRRHMLFSALILAAIVVVGAIIYDRFAAAHTKGLVEALEITDSRGLPNLVEAVTDYRHRAAPLLKQRLADLPAESDKRAKVCLGLVAAGEPTPKELFDHLLSAEPALAVAIADNLQRYDRLNEIAVRLTDVALDAQEPPGKRLRAAVAVARSNQSIRVFGASAGTPRERDLVMVRSNSAGTGKRQSRAEAVSGLLLGDIAINPGHFEIWVEALAPVRESLIGPVRQSFQSAPTEAERLLAANVLARYLAGDVPQVVELALQSDPKQFGVFARLLQKSGAELGPKLAREASAPLPDSAPEEEKDRIARRAANAILLLREMGNDQYLWPALEHRRDPRLRSFLIHHFHAIPSSVDEWLRRLNQSQDAGVRQALILFLGSPANAALSVEEALDLTQALLQIHRDDVDAGVHSAAEWTLRRLGGSEPEERIHESIDMLSHMGLRDGYRWYVTPSKLTMIVFTAPISESLGSPATERGHESDETEWTADVDWSFAVSATEVPQAKYLEICPEYEYAGNEFAPGLNCPANAVTWLEAARFCRLLSEKDGVSDDEMAIPAGNPAPLGPYPDFLTRTGYRLPTEVEWEIACRAGTVTPRFFGFAADLLPSYCCYIDNSQGHAWNVGSGLPNRAGLFDMLGNVSEWCLDVFKEGSDGRATLHPVTSGVSPFTQCVVRGNDYASTARMARAANRRFDVARLLPYSRGFRIAHTVRSTK
jgi:formylglycine-generating enzyme required for sulfatase activity